MKLGAFSPCHKCGFDPASPEDQARSILLSSHNLDDGSLAEAGRRITRGDAPRFDEAVIAETAAQIDQILKNPPPKPRGCLVIQCILIGIIIALFVAVIYMVWYLKHS